MNKRLSAISGRVNMKWLTGFFVVFFCCAFYAALVSFRTMPISEGWYTEYAWLINHGSIPYKDFEYLFFPLYMFIMAGFTSVFGYSILALRVLGVLVFAGIGGTLYCIFSKLFDNLSGMVGAIITAIFMQSEIGQMFYDYIRFHDLFAFISAYFLISLSCDCYNNVYRPRKRLASATGFFTYYLVPGIIALIGLAGIIIYPLSEHPLRWLGFLLFFCTGSLLIVLSVFCFKNQFLELAEREIPSNAILCGVFAGAECMVKQSNGTLMIVMILLFTAFCAIALRNGRFLKALLGFIAGVAFAFSFLVIYLLATDSLGDFIRCCFGAALDAKGGLASTLFRWIWPNLKPVLSDSKTVIICLAMYITGLNYLRGKNLEIKKRGVAVWAIVGLCGVFAVALWGFFEVERVAVVFAPKYNAGIPGLVFFPCAFLFFVYSFYLVGCWLTKKQPDGLGAEFFPAYALLGVIFAQGYGVGMSGGLGTSQVAIALGLIIAFCLHGALLAGAKVSVACLLSCSLFLTGTFISRKTVQTYDWWGLTQDRISQHTESVDVPLLEGIKVRSMDKQCYEEIYNDVMEHTQEGDTIFVFPHAPIFYTITDRHSVTYSKVQWFDVSSPAAIQRDIEALRENLPKVLIHVNIPDWVYEGHESSFHTYQTREMNEFLMNELVPENGYVFIRQVDIGNGFMVSSFYLPEQ